jgi:Predicted membrane protein (DUF2335)
VSRKNRDRNIGHTQNTSLSVQAQMHQWSGPLPQPEALERYNQIVPSAAERIIRMAETQHDHRIEIEKSVVGFKYSRSKAGNNLGVHSRYDRHFRWRLPCLHRKGGYWIGLYCYRTRGIGWSVRVWET